MADTNNNRFSFPIFGETEEDRKWREKQQEQNYNTLKLRQTLNAPAVTVPNYTSIKVSNEPQTRQKQYSTDLLGFMSGITDKIMGNDTEEVNPHDKGEIKQDNRSDFGRYMDNQLQHNNTPLGYAYRTVMPASAVAALPFTPALATGAAVAGGAAGGVATELGSYLSTGRSWSDNVRDYVGSELAPLTNPGALIGGISSPSRWRNSMYNSVTPFGYSSTASTMPKRKELGYAALNFLMNPKMFKAPNIPKWTKRINNNEVSNAEVILRDDAWRKALKLKPRTRNIDGEEQTLYLDNGDGTVRYNLNYIKSLGIDPKIVVNADNPAIGTDKVGWNGGVVNLTHNPKNPNLITITDKWDIQPFSDERSLLPWLTEFANRHPNWFTNKFKNFEVIKSVNGNPFTLKQTLSIPKDVTIDFSN